MAGAGNSQAGRKPMAVWMQGLLCGLALTFAMPSMLLLGVLLAPCIACKIGEAQGRGMTRAVTLGCVAAAIGPFWRLWQHGGRMAVAMMLLSDPKTICLAWGAGAVVWSLCQVVPVMLRGAWEAREAMRSARMRGMIAALREEWDLMEE